MQRKTFVWLVLVLGGCHFLVSLLIVPLTLLTGDVLPSGSVKSMLMGGLHFLTKVFYYPIMAYALYPRHWFPGSWITIPILVNSLLCGFLLACVVLGAWRMRSAK